MGEEHTPADRDFIYRFAHNEREAAELRELLRDPVQKLLLLLRCWQDVDALSLVYSLTEDSKRLDREAEDWFRKAPVENGYPAPSWELDRGRECLEQSTQYQNFVLMFNRDIGEIEELVRCHFPSLLGTVPLIDFRNPRPADLVPTVREFLALEGAVLARLNSPPDERTARLAQAELTKASGNRPAPDFRSVVWDGEDYTFTTMQAACVKILWELWEQGLSAIGEPELLDRAGASSERLRDVFDKGKHPAWNTMIISPNKGSYGLRKSPEN